MQECVRIWRSLGKSMDRPAWSQSLEPLVRNSIACEKYKHVSLYTDCTGFDAPGQAMDLCGWLPSSHISGSELDPMIYDLLQATGLEVSHDMRHHDFSQHARRNAGSMRLYVAGTPCQGFSLRNCKRKRWEDPRSELLVQAMSKIHMTQVIDAGILENSNTLLRDQRLGGRAAFQV